MNRIQPTLIIIFISKNSFSRAFAMYYIYIYIYHSGSSSSSSRTTNNKTSPAAASHQPKRKIYNNGFSFGVSFLLALSLTCHFISIYYVVVYLCSVLLPPPTLETHDRKSFNVNIFEAHKRTGVIHWRRETEQTTDGRKTNFFLYVWVCVCVCV